MGRYSRLERIRRMDPRHDHEQIFQWITRYEFPWDYMQGVSVAFLRDYGVPRISRLLDRTQEFERAGQKRYDDTVLIAYEMVRHGMDSPHGRATARHLNRIHGRYRIANEDYLYVLATTVVGPKRWIDRYGWRPSRPKPRSDPFGWTLDDLGPHWAHQRPPAPLADENPPMEHR
ncbi:hypothetical protein J2X68_000938 [Streptomyces sp. 3330]|uniref:hypothetical protein n=1 Tax=Streptomyces sp. 3330 TaxID=2817755 RepID=UPI0028674C21|nr:hypothetical protein [Streptomyces sp. 3330]MDR6974260.1 hypothetical protein [Streptomyces sp. 3330]